MKTSQKIASLIAIATEQMGKNLADIQQQKVDKDGSIEQVEQNIAEYLDKVIRVIHGVSYELDGAVIPQFLHNWKYLIEDGKIVCITLSVKSRLKAKHQLKESRVIYLNDKFEENICDLIGSVALQLFKLSLAEENINGFMKKLVEVILNANYSLPFDIDFAISDTPVVDITDDAITLGISLDSAYDLDRCILFNKKELSEGELDYSNELVQDAEDKFIEELKAVQTPVQLIKAKISLFEGVCYKTKRGVPSILKSIYHKQAKYLTNKDGIGYVSAEVELDGEKVGIFALVRKQMLFDKNTREVTKEDFEVILSPFNKDTLETVDIDIIPYATFVSSASNDATQAEATEDATQAEATEDATQAEATEDATK